MVDSIPWGLQSIQSLQCCRAVRIISRILWEADVTMVRVFTIGFSQSQRKHRYRR